MASVKNEPTRSCLCRVCMENRPEMISIFSKLDHSFIANIIVEWTAVQIMENDGLPDNICVVCVQDLKNWLNFVDKTRKSDHVLRQMLSTEIKSEHIDVEELNDSASGEVEPSSFTEVLVALKVEAVKNESDDARSEDETNIEYEDEHDIDYVYNDSSDDDYKVTKRRKTNQPQSSTAKKKRGRKRKTSVDEEAEYSNMFEELDEVELQTFQTVDVGDQVICCTCLKLFDSLKLLKEHGEKDHRRNPNSAKKFICEFCLRRYASAEALKLHLKKVKRITQVYDCLKCEARFTASSRRRNHAHHHPKMIPKSSVIIAAIPITEELGKICCAQGCNAVFETEEELMVHSVSAHKANKVQSILNCSEQRPVECPICYKRFTDETGLKTHQQRVYLPKRHVCSICGLKFSQPGELTRHEREHRNEKIFKCEQCPKAYFSMDRLKAHVKRHTATREFMCNVCGQSYMQKHNLQAHMLMHEGKLPFECEVCKKAFRVKAKMIYHMRVHSGERPYPCRYCDIAFADSTNRLRHEMSHTGIKPYKCDYCEKTFITKRLKKEHESTHSGQKPYKCTLCFEAFNQSSALKTHLAHHVDASQESSVQLL